VEEEEEKSASNAESKPDKDVLDKIDTVSKNS